MTEAKKRPQGAAYMLKLAGILLLISALTALALALVNHITEDRINAIKLEKTNAALAAVMPGAFTFTDVGYEGEDALVKTVYHAVSGTNTYGYVVEVIPSGFGGEIDMVVGIDLNGTVTGVSIISMSETSNLGTNANKEDWQAQFVGADSALTVDKDGGTIDALTGATVTSRAVISGVNAALAAVQG